MYVSRVAYPSRFEVQALCHFIQIIRRLNGKLVSISNTNICLSLKIFYTVHENGPVQLHVSDKKFGFKNWATIPAHSPSEFRKFLEKQIIK